MTRERNVANGEKDRLELKAPSDASPVPWWPPPLMRLQTGWRYPATSGTSREAVRAGLLNTLGVEALSATEKKSRRWPAQDDFDARR